MVMAQIYANCGEYELAIEQLEEVLELETIPTVNSLKYMPWIDPFRDNPRYQLLMEKYAL